MGGRGLARRRRLVVHACRSTAQVERGDPRGAGPEAATLAAYRPPGLYVPRGAARSGGAAPTSPRACPRPTRSGFDDYPDIAGRSRLLRASGTSARAVRPSRLLADLPVERRPRPTSRPSASRVTHRPASGSASTRVRPRASSWPAVASRRCYLLRHPDLPLLLRHPEGSGLLRQPPADRGPRRGSLARRPRRTRAVPRQRELHLLRQGPRRPPAPRVAAARSGRRSTGSTACASPTSSPPRPGPG